MARRVSRGGLGGPLMRSLRGSPLAMEALEQRLLLAGVSARELQHAGDAVVLLDANFESGAAGFTIDNTGGRTLGMWHFSSGRRRDGLPNHSPDYSFYYGLFETSTGGGRYDLSLSHQGRLRTPTIAVPACGHTAADFHYLLDTRDALDIDFVEFRVESLTTGQTTTLLSRAAGTLPETDGVWVAATADLSQFAGQDVRLVFSFDTGGDIFIDPEGWYVDDVLVVNGECRAGEISGRKFNDVNLDGVRQNDEPALPGVVITLQGDADGDGAADMLSATTDDDGVFTFGDLAEGTYVLTEQPPPHAVGDPARIEVTLAAEQSLEVDVANQLAGAVAGFKFHDANDDGAFDAAMDAPLAGVVFTLNNDQGFEQSIETDADGVFLFSDVSPGQYTLTETPPEGLAGTALSVAIEIRSGELLVSSPDQAPASLAGQFTTVDPSLLIPNQFVGGLRLLKFHDEDGDAVLDDNEAPLADIAFVLEAADGTRREAQSGVDGVVEFRDVPPGEYDLRELQGGRAHDGALRTPRRDRQRSGAEC